MLNFCVSILIATFLLSSVSPAGCQSLLLLCSCDVVPSVCRLSAADERSSCRTTESTSALNASSYAVCVSDSMIGERSGLKSSENSTVSPKICLQETVKPNYKPYPQGKK